MPENSHSYQCGFSTSLVNFSQSCRLYYWYLARSYTKESLRKINLYWIYRVFLVIYTIFLQIDEDCYQWLKKLFSKGKQNCKTKNEKQVLLCSFLNRTRTEGLAQDFCLPFLASVPDPKPAVVLGRSSELLWGVTFALALLAFPFLSFFEVSFGTSAISLWKKHSHCNKLIAFTCSTTFGVQEISELVYFNTCFGKLKRTFK